MKLTRRKLLAATGAVSVASVTGCLDNGSKEPVEYDGPVATAPIPSNPEEYNYAVMGEDSAEVTVDYFGNWKCPYCAQFTTGFLEDLVQEYVETGDIILRYRGLTYMNGEPFLGPDAPRAERAGLGVWEHDPENYWNYHEYVFRNQPPEGRQWATVDKLTTMMKRATVENRDEIQSAFTSDTYEPLLQQTTNRANQLGVSGTPLLAVNGQVVPALNNESTTRNAIDRALEQ